MEKTKLYPIQPDLGALGKFTRYFPGRLTDGTQALIVVAPPTMAVYWFTPEGKFLRVESKMMDDWSMEAPREERAETKVRNLLTMIAELGLTQATIFVEKVCCYEAPILFIHDEPTHFESSVTEDDEHIRERWKKLGRFVVGFNGVEYYFERDGKRVP